MRSIGSYEAKTHLPQLLEQVSQGESITITKHGIPVALLIPVETRPRPDVLAVIKQIKKSRKGRSLKNVSIKDLIEEGRT